MKLENDYLEIELLRDRYEGQRFDNTGFITGVWLKESGLKKDGFCTEESLIPGKGTGGLGLANEFDIDEPTGYKEAAPGERFLKIGVGWLEKQEECQYRFSRHYNVLAEGVMSQITSVDEIHMKWDSGVWNGYGCLYEKSIRLADDTVVISYRLENRGSRKLATSEYAHNFICLGNRSYMPDEYTLKTTDARVDAAYPCNYLLDQFPSYMVIPKEECGEIKSWELRNRFNGMSVSETVDFIPSKCAIWAMPHVISFEIFMGMELEPGETANWKRTYAFKKESGSFNTIDKSNAKAVHLKVS